MGQRFLVTGGAGFIGSAVVRKLINDTDCDVLVYDKLTYAGNVSSLAAVSTHPRYRMVHGDIADADLVRDTLETFKPDVIMHLAAETHVDRSIDGPGEFIQTNVVGTYVLLQAALHHWSKLDAQARERFRFHHISTDEVFGSLGPDGFFQETTPYDPRSPYSASKASSDHLVSAWHHTYGLPVVLTNCSNNYGPYHFPEKLIPLVIINALESKPLPIYGQGTNIRDWLFVDDHADALVTVATEARIGESYNIGGRAERTNLQVVEAVCDLLDELKPVRDVGSHRDLITFVSDRPGHDLRYAIDASKIERDLRWTPRHTFEVGLRKTVMWYIENRPWWDAIRQNTYAGQRLGLKG